MENSTTSRIVVNLIRGLIAAILASVSVALYTAYINPELRLHGLVLARRDSGCSVGQVLDTRRILERENDRTDTLRREIRRVEQNGAGLELWETPAGRFWVPGRTSHNLPALLAEQEQRIYGSGKHWIRPGDIVLDCGAHVGAFTRLALSAGAQLVVAVEVSPENITCLRRTFASEIAGGRVIVYPKGVWDRDDLLTLWTPSGTSLDDSVVVRPENAGHGVKVPLTTIDKLVAELGLGRVDFIKLDVEGAEEKALAGSRATLKRYKPRLSVAMENFPDQPQKIPATVGAIRSDYRRTLGRCWDHLTWLQPHVLYFD